MLPTRPLLLWPSKDVLARRLEQMDDHGQPGATILITEATYRQVEDYVRVDLDVCPLKAKGKEDPIRVYQVLGSPDMEG